MPKTQWDDKKENLIKFVQDFKTTMEFSNSDSNTDKVKMYRSSHPEMFCKKGILKNFAKFTGKNLCRSLFFKTIAA